MLVESVMIGRKVSYNIRYVIRKISWLLTKINYDLKINVISDQHSKL